MKEENRFTEAWFQEQRDALQQEKQQSKRNKTQILNEPHQEELLVKTPIMLKQEQAKPEKKSFYDTVQKAPVSLSNTKDFTVVGNLTFFQFCISVKECRVFHIALYWHLCQIQSDLGKDFKDEFQIQTLDILTQISLVSKRSYLKSLKDLQKWGFLEIIYIGINKYKPTIIKLNATNNISHTPPAGVLNSSRQDWEKLKKENGKRICKIKKEVRIK